MPDWGPVCSGTYIWLLAIYKEKVVGQLDFWTWHFFSHLDRENRMV
jgi:hypothetical protein